MPMGQNEAINTFGFPVVVMTDLIHGQIKTSFLRRGILLNILKSAFYEQLGLYLISVH